MWHASIAIHGATWAPTDRLFQLAREQLWGVGDAALGEWREIGEAAVHVRRRMSDREAAIVGPVVDIRGTPEARERCARVQRYLPRHMQGVEQ